MSVIANIDKIPYESRKKINKELEIKIENKFNTGANRYIYPFEIINDNIILPFSYGVKSLNIKRPTRKQFPTVNINFNGKARPEQNEVLDEAITKLSKTGSILLSMYCGFGKTACAIKLACNVNFRTLIIVNKIILIKQWEESINKFCPDATVQKLTAKSKQKICDFYIMNAQNVEKLGKEFFSEIGLVIVDEAHLIMAETLSRSLQHIFPRYIIGLTATPYRPDGLDKLIELYFGNYKIVRKLWRKHTVFKISTGFKPTIEYANNGRVNWGVVLDSQANNQERNEMIIKILKHFSDRNFLVLTKRISQGKYLIERLKEENEDVTSLIGNKQEFEVNSRILIGTSSKVGVGFDHPKLNALLLAGDLEEYFVQYLGRVFRTKDDEPIIIDLVDKYSILEKHYNTRRKIYQDHGGTVKNFNINNI